MHKLSILFLLAVFMASCNNEKKKDKLEITSQKESIQYKSFGEEITVDGTISLNEAINEYKNLKLGDTLSVKFTSNVKEVCQNKGCWMRLDMGPDETMVKFKDYGFFMPIDIAGQDVIVEGRAYIEEMSVEDQKHFAEDAGKTDAEIAEITEPKRTLSFISSGVLVAEKQ